MSITLDAFRAKLVIKILYASSTDEVKRYIEAGIRALYRKKISAQAIAQFIDQIINQLEFINPIKTDPAQGSRLNIAKLFLRRAKEPLISTMP